jgi:glycosyltransferase involved in cell wall biosynthesis
MSICLVMIVKNEEHVIQRSLEAALPAVDSWVIVDTGSTDSTMEKIQDISQRLGIPGQLYQRPWVNFGHNRSEALALARKEHGVGWWSLMLDADDILSAPKRQDRTTFLKQNPLAQCFTISIKRGTLAYRRPILFNNGMAWRFAGAVHEYAECPGAGPSNPQLPLPDTFSLDARCEGARSQDPLKYQKDAELLEKELAGKPNDTRSMFYAAQSYRDSGNREKARHWYTKRAEAGGWAQERYVSYLNLMRLTDSVEEKFTLAWKAIEICPERLECSHDVLKTTRSRGQWSRQALALAEANRRSAPRSPHADWLFVDPASYEYEFDDELSIHAYYMSRDDVAAPAAFRAMAKAPPAQLPRIRANYEFSLKRLAN